MARIFYKAKTYAHFPKLVSKLVKTNRITIYCENIAYYNTSPSLSVTEGNKKSNTHIHKRTTFKQFKRN